MANLGRMASLLGLNMNSMGINKEDESGSLSGSLPTGKTRASRPASGPLLRFHGKLF